MQVETSSCRDRKVLEGRYYADLRVYLYAVRGLEQPLTKREFDQAYENANRAKTAFEHARDLLNTHVAEHGCSVLY